MQRLQIHVTRNDDVGPAIQRDFQELVIFGVAAFADWVNDGNNFCGMCDEPDELQALFKGDVTIDLACARTSASSLIVA